MEGLEGKIRDKHKLKDTFHRISLKLYFLYSSIEAISSKTPLTLMIQQTLELTSKFHQSKQIRIQEREEKGMKVNQQNRLLKHSEKRKPGQHCTWQVQHLDL